SRGSSRHQVSAPARRPARYLTRGERPAPGRLRILLFSPRPWVSCALQGKHQRTPGNNTESGRTMSAASPISLADFHFLRVRVHWAEAVAIVEDLCALLAGSGQNGGIPDLRDIATTSHGTLT